MLERLSPCNSLATVLPGIVHTSRSLTSTPDLSGAYCVAGLQKVWVAFIIAFFHQPVA